MKDAFPELKWLYERPDESVVKQRKTLSEIMNKVRERKRGDSASASDTPVQKVEKRPQAKKMPDDIKQSLKNYEENKSC